MTTDAVLDLAKRLLLELDEVRPMLIILGEKGATRIPLDGLPQEPEQKTKALLALGYAVARESRLGELQQLFFLSEAWMTTAPLGTPLKTMPIDDPKRREVLILAQRTRDPGTTMIQLFEINRSSEEIELQRIKQVEDPRGSAESPTLDSFLYGYEQGLQAKGS
jgi:hypothetical protein